MEDRAYGVLRRKLARIKRSNVDPAWLAGELMAATIIGSTELQKAKNPREVKDERLGELVENVMRNGAPDVFQTFVGILLKEDQIKWLGEELKGMTLPLGYAYLFSLQYSCACIFQDNSLMASHIL